MGEHINVDGKFQSDKYPTCPAGKVPLSVTDPAGQDLLWEYAQRRRVDDAEFSDDLETALKASGYKPPEQKSVQAVFVNSPMKAYRVWVTMPDGSLHTGSVPYQQRERAESICAALQKTRGGDWQHNVREEEIPRDDPKLGRIVSVLLGVSDAWTEVKLSSKLPTNESPLAMMCHDLLAKWDQGDMARGWFESEMRELICHFAKFYLPRNEDGDKLKLVAKLAYQFKLRHQGFFIGGTKITPFWDAIDDLPSRLLNEAHAEIVDEIATWKKDRP